MSLPLPMSTYAALLQEPPNKKERRQSLIKSVIKLPDSIIRVSAKIEHLAAVANSNKLANQSSLIDLADTFMKTTEEEPVVKEHVVHRHDTCIRTLLKMLAQLYVTTQKANSAYQQTAHSIAVFKDYCEHLTSACTINYGSIGSLQILLTVTPTMLTTSPHKNPSFAPLADYITTFCQTAIPISTDNKHISSKTYLPSFLKNLNNKCESVLEETILFIKTISSCNSTPHSNISGLQLQLILARASNVQLPEYTKGAYMEQWKGKNPQEIYLEMEIHISHLNSIYQHLQRALIETMKYVADVVAPTAEELYNMMKF